MKNTASTQNTHPGQADRSFWWRAKPDTCAAPAPRPGDRCLQCASGILAYNEQFILACPHCGAVAEVGAFT
ncbi:MAG: hypothetical protein KC418_16565 [Anaerolineales bacterium]|nr:hypothetical protein [Anaerolineales bacterium]MCB8954820.1 hypothetical protein [Ardenticatenales bacterium]